MDRAIVVKIGGSTLGSTDTTFADLVTLQKQGQPVVVVHGGGKVITDWLNKQGVKSQFVRGERVTDLPALEVVTAVLAGLVNKDIVALINSLGGQAVGLSGVDGRLVQAQVKNAELGYVGSIVAIDARPLQVLLGAGFIPVVAPVGYHLTEAPDGAARLLNINADTVAGEIAAALGATRLIFLTDVAGILDKSGKLMPTLSPGEAGALVSSGVASGGMIPKVNACLRALSGGGTTCIIDGRASHALIQTIRGGGAGTFIG